MRLYGEDLDVLKARAEEIKDALADIEGIDYLHVDLQEKIPQIEVETDLEAARRYGIKPGDVRRAAATLIAGTEVADAFKDGRAYDVNVWGTPNTRQNAASVSELVIDTPEGGQVKLEDVATVSLEPSPNIITRKNFKRRIDVGANATGRDLAAVVADVKNVSRRSNFRWNIAMNCWASTQKGRPPSGRSSFIRSPRASASCCCCRLFSPADGWQSWPSSRCRRRSSAVCWQRCSAMAMFQSARLSGSLRCSELQRGMSSSSSTTVSILKSMKGRRLALRWWFAAPRNAWRRS